jgi:hypothetical protein
MRVRKNGKRRKGNTEEFSGSRQAVSLFEDVWRESPDHEEEKQWSLPA